MPLVDVTYDGSVTDAELEHLAEVLPDIVAEAVACPEEPWTGPPGPGDIEIRFRLRGRFDVGEMACVIEVRTSRRPSRERDTQERAERARRAVAHAIPSLGPTGVWLVLHDGSWAQ